MKKRVACRQSSRAGPPHVQQNRSRRRAALSLEEQSEFREAVKDVQPLKRPVRAIAKAPPPPPIPKQSHRDERDVLDSLLTHAVDLDSFETGEELLFLRPGLQHNLLRRLRRGHFAIQASFDLHGLTVPEAKEALGIFLAQVQRQGLRCVRIIHGKGLSSPNREPILKGKVRGWLMQREEVLAFAQARPTEGGSGAVVVLLARRQS
ncbi:MAG: Smr/MutS family protein [Pseudomonadota bacterium]